MTDEKWRSPTGSPISSHVTDANPNVYCGKNSPADVQAALDAMESIFLTICPTMTWPSGAERQQGRITLEEYNTIRNTLTQLTKPQENVTCGAVKEVIEWLDDAFADISDSRERMGKSTDVLDRCERVLNTIRTLTAKQQPDVGLLEALKDARLSMLDNGYNTSSAIIQKCNQAIARAEQKGGV